MPAPDTRIRILALAPTLGQGGAERVLSLLLEHLDREQYAPELAIFESGSIAYEVPDDVPVHVLADRPAAVAQLPIAVPVDLALRFEDTLAWLGATAAKLAELVRELEPDVIVSSPVWASIMVSIASSGFPARTRAVHRVDAPPSVPLAEYPWRDLFAYFIQQHFSQAGRVVAVAGGVADDLVSTFGVDPAKIVVIHNPATIERVEQMAAEPIGDLDVLGGGPFVLFVGRLERVKGLEYLFRAVARVMRSRQLRLLLVGEGSQRGYLVALAKHLGIENSVHFLGRQSNPFKLMSRATMLVMPSLSEGMSNVLVEAMACRCPIVATDIKGGITRELLNDGDVGLIVPREDAEALAEAIERLLGDTALRERFASRGFLRAKDFYLPVVMRQYEEAILAAAATTSEGAMAQVAPAVARSQATALGPTAGGPAESVRRLAVAAITIARRGARFAARRAKARLIAVRARLERARARKPAAPTLARPQPGGARTATARGRLLVLVPTVEDPALASVIDTLVPHLARLGWLVTLASWADRATPRLDGATYVSLDRVLVGERVDVGAVAGVTVAGREADLKWLAVTADRVYQLVTDAHISAVFAGGWEAARLALMAKRCGAASVPVITYLPGRFRDLVGGSTSDLDRALVDEHLGKSDLVITPREDTAAETAERVGALQGRITVLPDPVDVPGEDVAAEIPDAADHPWLQDGSPFFLGVGTREADVTPLLEAARSAATRDAVRVLVAIDGALVNTIKSSISSMQGDEATVSIVDCRHRAGALFEHAVALVHAGAAAPGVPEAVARAMRLGCPVISTRSSEQVARLLDDGRAGVLVRPGDANGLAEAMLQLLWDEDVRRGFAQRASERLVEVSADGVAARLDRLIEGIVADQAIDAGLGSQVPQT